MCKCTVHVQIVLRSAALTAIREFFLSPVAYAILSSLRQRRDLPFNCLPEAMSNPIRVSTFGQAVKKGGDPGVEWAKAKRS